MVLLLLLTELLSLLSSSSSSSIWLHEQSKFGNRRQLSSISLILLLRLLLSSDSGCCRSIGELRLILPLLLLLRSLPVSGKEILYFLCNVPSANIVKHALTHKHARVRVCGSGSDYLSSAPLCLVYSFDFLCSHLKWKIIDFHPRNDGNYPKLEQKRPETLSKHIFVEFR